ncbi:hypothetical protein [Asticcacaulis machinosus]|uniref:Uncharacterized protein n=1 Tax=Asticcacaulis machinosus TaxID=2984211 RepID=A0ABT5HL58_9CAUL|nr:hypothetical protein [Asticcacaulis machinosus]MDC7676981.1 hypothetical protein [Asticcacaulis machinosus]
MLHLGAAHFGDINFDLSELTGDTKDCTCALCQRSGTKHQIRVALRLADLDMNENTREFGRHPLQHHFCLTSDTGHADSGDFSTPSDFGYLLNAR